jgi:hypothetical protein
VTLYNPSKLVHHLQARLGPEDKKKIAQKVAKSKKAKISSTKLNLKAQNIYNKPLLKLLI